MIHFELLKTLAGDGAPLHLNIAQEITPGELVTVYGKSGAGKTSLLRMIAGLLKPDSGTLTVNGHTWEDTKKGIHLKPQLRKVGFVFQDFALFPNMTVLENLEFALPKKQDSKAIETILEVIELGALKGRKPHTLSGGQKQRVALARALVGNPQLLLLDEPLSAVDYEMRAKLQTYLLQVHKEFKLTTLLVSHDIGEIYKLSNSVIHLENGQVIRSGKPLDLFSHHHLSGKFQFVGEVLELTPEDVIYVVSVLIDNNLVRVIVDQQTAKGLKVGDKVLVASKAFNPIIQKI